MKDNDGAMPTDNETSTFVESLALSLTYSAKYKLEMSVAACIGQLDAREVVCQEKSTLRIVDPVFWVAARIGSNFVELTAELHQIFSRGIYKQRSGAHIPEDTIMLPRSRILSRKQLRDTQFLHSACVYV